MPRTAPARLLIVAAAGCLVLALALRGSDADRALFLAVNDAAWRWLPAALPSCLTILGHGLGAVMVLSPALMRRPSLLLAGLCAGPVALLLSRLPKVLIDSPRPAAVLDAASIHISGMRLAGHNSFPSGHSITAFVVAGVLIAAGGFERGFDRSIERYRPFTVGIILLAACAVALSRIAVGAHWPSDTLGGAGLGLLAALAGVQVQRRWLPVTGRASVRAVLAVLVLGCAIELVRLDLGYPLARLFQLALAAFGVLMAAIALWRLWGERRSAARSAG